MPHPLPDPLPAPEHDQAAPRPRRVVILIWRDTSHPEGGGSERYVERIASGLAATGDEVTILCADHGRAPRDEVRDGVLFRRRGGRWTVYARSLAYLARHPADVVVDVQNGVPFFSPLVTRRPVVVLVHHVHREQWPVVMGPRAARLGWWVESWLAPRVYRGRPYVAVSAVTRRELAELGVDERRVTVVHNGIDRPAETLPPLPPLPPLPQPAPDGARDAAPLLCCVARLVPHKRIEHALEVLARLRARWPALRLAIVGDGWAAGAIYRHAAQLGVSSAVDLLGHVDEATKHQVLARSLVHLCPSLKEGWGLVIMEAAMHGVPTVAYRSAGGVADSVVDGETGLLADDLDDFAGHVERLLADPSLRRRLGQAARVRSENYAWPVTVTAFAAVLAAACGGRPGSAPTPVSDRRTPSAAPGPVEPDATR
jgi:glycosyltransferase involved in cell wall biosynthesis